MKHAAPSRPRRILEFLGSVKMTVVLLVLGVVVMAFGTFLESLEDAAVAKATVYKTFWFDTFLVLIAVNLAAAVINRLPLKRHQLAFAVTHASIIVLMLGAWMSRSMGYEGQLAVVEGQGSDNLYLHDREIVLVGPLPGETDPSHQHKLAQFPLPDTVYLAGEVLREETAEQSGLRIVDSVHKGFLFSRIAPAEEGAGAGPGVAFVASGGGGKAEGSLLAFHPTMRRYDMGMMSLELLQFRDQESLEARMAPMSTESAIVVERGEGEEVLRLPVPASVGTETELRPGVTVAVLNYAERSRVIDNRLQDDPRANYNPAAVLEIRAEGRVERHTVFSEFPDFSMHQLPEGEPLAAGVRLEAFGAVSKPLLSLLVGPDDALYAQVSDSKGRQQAVPMPAENHFTAPELPFLVHVESFHPAARIVNEVRKAEPGQDGGRFHVQVEVTQGGRSERYWLIQGQPRAIPLLGEGMNLDFRRRVRTLPFRVDVDAFNVEYYPGSMRPSNYASEVRVSANDGSTPLVSTTISMNRPLDYMGYRIFQSSYVSGQGGQPDTTVFSVAYDPGVPVVYASFVFLILGVAWYVMGDGRRKDGKGRGHGRKSAQDKDYVLTPESSATAGNPSETADAVRS